MKQYIPPRCKVLREQRERLLRQRRATEEVEARMQMANPYLGRPWPQIVAPKD